jgi:hypothetical protein
VRLKVAPSLLVMRGSKSLGGGDAPARRVEEREVGGLRGIAQQRRIGGAGKGILLRDIGELDGVFDEAIDAGFGEVAGRRHRDAAPFHDPQTGRPMPRLFHELRLAQADFRRQLGAGAPDALGDGDPPRGGHRDDAIPQREQVFELTIVVRSHPPRLPRRSETRIFRARCRVRSRARRRRLTDPQQSLAPRRHGPSTRVTGAPQFGSAPRNSAICGSGSDFDTMPARAAAPGIP